MNNDKQQAQELIDFIERSPSTYHAVNNIREELNEAGFQELDLREEWTIEKGGKYFTTKNGSALFAFVIGAGEIEEEGFQLICAHSDAPGFKIKPNPEIEVEGNYLKLNTEVYGGPILSSWLDRLLSCSGQVAIRSTNPLDPIIKTVDFNRPFLTIPNSAIHLNPDLNKGLEYNKQNHFQPIMSTIDGDTVVENFMVHQIAQQLEVDPTEILDFDLHIYLAEPATLIGINQKLISSPRLDNLAMVYTSLRALCDSTTKTGISMAVCFDHEEIGSRTKQGGQGALLQMVLQQVMQAKEKIEFNWLRALQNSLVISADATHAFHPNYPEKSDETNQPQLNKGIAIKYSGNKKYATDSETAAIIKQLCEKAEIPYQTYVNRSDILGGSTIGPMVESLTGIKTVDIGPPMLAMHSAREVMGLDDFYDAMTLFKTFYEV
jgi:aspartyl aminopeptidase